MSTLWMFSYDSGYQLGNSLTGFAVEAEDGSIGHVERQEENLGMQHLVVETGVWKFGGSVLIPAGAVTAIKTQEQTVQVKLSKEEIKAAPRFTTDSETTNQAYLTEVDNYYRTLGF
ncbi:PRC-barrel domain containing protein [Streptomyces microflavus]|uniref:PRC-barrel domain containing protein n=1 Tax=Streptomyces griseus group TaxID=629295 RepID=UPI003655BF1B